MRGIEVSLLFGCLLLAGVTESRISKLLKREEQYETAEDVEIADGDYDDVSKLLKTNKFCEIVILSLLLYHRYIEVCVA